MEKVDSNSSRSQSPSPSDSEIEVRQNVRRIQKSKSRDRKHVKSTVSKPEETDETNEASKQIRRKKSKAFNIDNMDEAERNEQSEDDPFDLHSECNLVTSPPYVRTGRIKPKYYSSNILDDDEEDNIEVQIKSMNLVERPRSQGDKKRVVRNRIKVTNPTTAPVKKNDMPTVVLDTTPTDIGNYPYFKDTRAESMHNVFQRKKSLTKDRELASNVHKVKSRLKQISLHDEKKAAINRPVVSPPLIIPPAYAPLFIREYGMAYPTLKDAGTDIKKQSSDRRSNQRSSSASVNNELRKRSASTKRTTSRTRELNTNSNYDEEDDEVHQKIREEMKAETSRIKNRARAGRRAQQDGYE